MLDQNQKWQKKKTKKKHGIIQEVIKGFPEEFLTKVRSELKEILNWVKKKGTNLPGRSSSIFSSPLQEQASLVAQTVKESAHNAEDLGSIPGSRRAPGEQKGNPLQHSCLENPMGGGAW